MGNCGNCGNEVPDGMNFCPNCGTEVAQKTSTDIQTDTAEQAMVISQSLAVQKEQITQNNTVQQQLSEPLRGAQISGGDIRPKEKRSILWMIVAIVSICLGIYSWIVKSPIITIVITLIALALGILSLAMKARLRALPIIAIVISGSLLIGWAFQGAIDANNGQNDGIAKTASQDPYEITFGRVTFYIPQKYHNQIIIDPSTGEFDAEGGKTCIVVARVDKCFSEGQFNNFSGMISELGEKCLEGVMEVSKSDASEYRDIGELRCVTIKYTGTVDGTDAICNTAFINDPQENCILLVENVFPASKKEYENDLDELLSNACMYKKSKSSSGNNDATRENSSMVSDAGLDSVIGGASSAGVNPELKAALDEYEAFVNEYVDFMKKYMEDPGNAISMIADYTSMVARLADFAGKIDAMKTDDMSKEDLAYYLDVINRVEKKLLDVAY